MSVNADEIEHHDSGNEYTADTKTNISYPSCVRSF